MMRTLAITRVTLLELRHSKLVVLPLTVAIALALVAANIENPNVLGNSLLEGMWGGLAAVGALLAILTASGVIAGDIERGTMQLMAARPVSRGQILAGKLIGVAVYLAVCVTVWAVVLAVGLGRQLDAGAWATFQGTLLVGVAMALAASVAVTSSVLFPTRGAIGTSLAVWFAVTIVAAIPLSSVRPENVERVELAQLITGWAIPVERLGELPGIAIDQPLPDGTVFAIAVIGAWVAAATLLLTLRRSVTR
jgi:ABC-type transport system involved in multi-copper enzyme maturation permease subunit